MTGSDCVARHPPLGESFYHIRDLGYFYADGSFSVVVPAGATTVRVSHGPEYDAVVRSVVVSGDTTVVIAMTRVEDMARHGWFGADTHVQMNTCAAAAHPVTTDDFWDIGDRSRSTKMVLVR